MTIHIIGFSHAEEPLPHELVFCGTFFAFLVISILGAIGIVLNYPTTLIMEAIITGLGFVMYLIVSFLAMFNAEQDHHLQYLTDKEEAQHFFFMMSRIQSIASLVGTFLFLMHFVICMDLLMIKKPLNEPLPGPSTGSVSILRPMTFAMADERAATSPLELELRVPLWCQRFLFNKTD